MSFSAATVSAATVTFPDFSSTTGLTINNNATATTTTDGSVLRLVPAKTSKAGSVFGFSTLNAASFSTFFKFRLSSPGGVSDGTEKGADGFAFVAQPISSTSGASGGGLGYQGIKPSIGVEFDTFRNAWDTSSNHIGIDQNGNISSLKTVDVTQKFDDGNIWYAWIDYNGTTLEVRANEIGERPWSTLMSYDLDIPAILGVNQAYVGFTAGTGAAYANHDIVSWEYHDSYNPKAAPIPGTSVIFGAGLLGLVMLRNKNLIKL